MRLLTLNCHSWQEKDQINKIRILAETIKDNSYDVIALQEVSQKIISNKIDGEVKKDNFVIVIPMPFASLKAQNVMKHVCLKPFFGYSKAVGMTINYKSRGGEWAALLVE
ncbi:MAG: hypothetical protein LRY71_06495 [Bacillaceae bacterium]|nr:hypothetical protein [Bacillaceae bacterium]